MSEKTETSDDKRINRNEFRRTIILKKLDNQAKNFFKFYSLTLLDK